MEPIGQKVLTNTSEEMLVSSEIDENSVENITKQIFDETLENVLLDTNVGKDFLSSQMEKTIKLDSSTPIDLTKRILNSGEASLETDIQQVPDSDIAMEVMEEILLTNEGSEEVNDKLQNLENIVSEKSDSKGNDIRINGNIFEDQEDFVKNIERDVERGESKKDILKNQLQTFFHPTDKSYDTETVKDVSKVVEKNNNSKNDQSVVTNSELFKELASKSESSNLKSVLLEKNQEGSEDKIVSHDNFIIDNENLKNNASNELEEISKDSDISNNSILHDFLKNSSQQNELDGNIDLKSEKSPDAVVNRLNIPEKIQTDSLAISLDEKTDRKIYEIENSERLNFKSSELSEDFESSKSLVSPRLDENFKAKQDFKLTNDRFPESETVSIKYDTRKIGELEKGITGVSVEEKLEAKNFENDIQAREKNEIIADKSILKEKFNQNLKLDDDLMLASGEKLVLKEKSNETRSPQIETFKLSEEQKILVREQTKETGGLSLPKNFKLSEEQKILVRQIPNDIIRENPIVKSSEDQKFFTKGEKILEMDAEGKNFINDPLNIDEIKTYSNLKSKEKDFGKEFSEKITVEKAQSNNKILLSQEIDSLTNSKVLLESNNPSIINTYTENSSLMSIKPAEGSSTLPESFRNLDLPFDIEKVLGRVRVMSGNGVEEMTLRLKPEELGNITLKISQKGGELTIDMRVDNPQVKQLVESGLDTLRNRFLDNEFSYQDLALNVDINERDSNLGKDRRNSAFEERMSSADRAEKKEISNSEEKISEGLTSDTGLNLYV